jgi:hypothetical protein
MRTLAMALIGALGAAAAALPANAAPLAPAPAAPEASNIIEIAGGCGRAFHRNRWGNCVPNRRYTYYRPYRYSYPRYGYYRWHTPSDFVANQLNAQELARSGGGYYYRGYGWGY